MNQFTLDSGFIHIVHVKLFVEVNWLQIWSDLGTTELAKTVQNTTVLTGSLLARCHYKVKF